MSLTKQDLKAIDTLLDNKLDEKFVDHLSLLEKRLDKKMDKRFEEVNERLDGVDEKLESIDKRLGKVEEFAEFAKPAIESLLEESQQTFELKIPKRVLALEDLHSVGVHTHAN